MSQVSFTVLNLKLLALKTYNLFCLFVIVLFKCFRSSCRYILHKLQYSLWHKTRKWTTPSKTILSKETFFFVSNAVPSWRNVQTVRQSQILFCQMKLKLYKTSKKTENNLWMTCKWFQQKTLLELARIHLQQDPMLISFSTNGRTLLWLWKGQESSPLHHNTHVVVAQLGQSKYCNNIWMVHFEAECSF